MKSLYVTDVFQFRGGELIEDAQFALTNAEIKVAVTGVPYLSLTLADKTGSITGLIFDCGAIPKEYMIGDALLVSGVFSKQYNNINIRQASKYAGPIDRDDFLAQSTEDLDAMYAEVLAIAGSVANPYLRTLLLGVFGDEDIEPRFRTWPAAREVHQAYIGGLLEHSLQVARLCERSAELYDVDRDLLVAGALLHDIGKLEELDCGLTITYTDIGSLLKHPLLGCFLVRDRIRNIEDFPEQLALSILHIIASHHGEPRWGAIAVPMTTEAFLVFMADDIDAKANRYQQLLDKQRPLEENISPRDYFLGTAVYAPRVEEEQWSAGF